MAYLFRILLFKSQYSYRHNAENYTISLHFTSGFICDCETDCQNPHLLTGALNRQYLLNQSVVSALKNDKKNKFNKDSKFGIDKKHSCNTLTRRQCHDNFLHYVDNIIGF